MSAFLFDLADAFSLVSPEPSGDGAYRSMKAALDDAGIDSIDDVSYSIWIPDQILAKPELCFYYN